MEVELGRSVEAPDPTRERSGRLRALIDRGTDRLVELIGEYAERYEYTSHAPGLCETFRASVVGLSESLLLALELYDDVPELHPDQDYIGDPIATSGVLAARHHRERGVRIGVFLGLFKYYRQGYHDLIDEEGLDVDVRAFAHRFLERFFDRVELSLVSEWTRRSTDDRHEELERTCEELEQRVAERTAKLEETHGQLLRSQKADAIGALAGGVAHDLNNLLQVIGGYGELLDTHFGDAEEAQRALLDQMVHAADRASSLVRQLLVFTRRQPMERRTLDINRTIENLSRMLRRIIGANVSIDLILSPGLPGVVGDEGSIEQVLMNLVVNARDAMPGGGVVTVRTDIVDFSAEGLQFPGTRPGSYVRLTVEDHGVGMSPETQQRAFEPFFTTREAAPGKGLGLSIVNDLVQQHDGWIHLYSEEGLGTTIKVYFPVSRDTAAPARADRTSLSQLGGAGERVLLVEDQDDVRTFITAVLAGNGYEVHPADSAPAALDLYAELGDRVDCVITDIVLWGQSGVQLAEQIQERSPEQRVLFITGYTADTARWSRWKDRGYRLLPKPFSMFDLLMTLRDVLDT
jgi:signal transduction histidine kinase/CheY-like chemotaxis protein